MTPNSESYNSGSNLVSNWESNLESNKWESEADYELGASDLGTPRLPESEALEHLELLMEQLQMVQHIAHQGHWLTTHELAMVLNLPLHSLQKIITEAQQNRINYSGQNNHLEPVYTFPWRNFYCQLIIELSPNLPHHSGEPVIFWQIVPRKTIATANTVNSLSNSSSASSSSSKSQYVTPTFELIHYPATNYIAAPSPIAPQPSTQPSPTIASSSPSLPNTIAPVLFTETNAFAQSPSEIIPVPFLQIDEFLSWQQLRDLFRYTIAQESNFMGSINTNGDENYRRSQVLYQFPEFESLIKTKLSAQIESVCQQLKIRSFIPLGIEAQLTAHNDGHFYKLHNDNGSPDTVNRILTYVYYFHREPKGFTGGELVLHDGAMENNIMMAAHSSHTIQPRNNSIVFFPSYFMHEVLPITCPSRKFVDSRFTINGWVRGA
ncbi:MAG: 2OG-Fe(II) oxygenase [Pseudanabaenaceae cyanobacterium]|jgi:SM-20-related protein